MGNVTTTEPQLQLDTQGFANILKAQQDRTPRNVSKLKRENIRTWFSKLNPTKENEGVQTQQNKFIIKSQRDIARNPEMFHLLMPVLGRLQPTYKMLDNNGCRVNHMAYLTKKIDELFVLGAERMV